VIKAKRVHKRNNKKWSYGNFYNLCGQLTLSSSTSKWSKVTCLKCLAKKPAKKKKEETHLYFQMDGEVSVVEKKEDGTIVSQELIDNYVVLKYLTATLERSLRNEDYWKEIEKESKEFQSALDEEYDKDRKARKYVRE
jgi:hypothetical protein